MGITLLWYSCLVLLAVLVKNKTYVIMFGCLFSLTVRHFIGFPNFWLDIVVLFMIVQTVFRCIIYGERIKIDFLTIAIVCYLAYLFARAAISMHQLSFNEAREIALHMLLYPLFLNNAKRYGWNSYQISKSVIIITILALISFLIFLNSPLNYSLFANHYGLADKHNIMYDNSFRFGSLFWGPLYAGQSFMILTMILFARRNILFIITLVMLVFTQTRAPFFLTLFWILCTILGAVIIPILGISFKIQRRNIFIILLIPITAIVIFSLIDYLAKENIIQLMNSRYSSELVSGRFLEERSPARHTLATYFGQSYMTMLFGNGINMGEIMVIQVDDGNFFKILFEQGLCGLLLYTFIYAIFLNRAITATTEWNRTIYVSLVFMFLIGTTTTVLSSYFSLHLLFAAAGIITNEISLQKKGGVMAVKRAVTVSG